jgi:hypothetical protein
MSVKLAYLISVGYQYQPVAEKDEKKNERCNTVMADSFKRRVMLRCQKQTLTLYNDFNCSSSRKAGTSRIANLNKLYQNLI